MTFAKFYHRVIDRRVEIFLRFIYFAYIFKHFEACGESPNDPTTAFPHALNFRVSLDIHLRHIS